LSEQEYNPQSLYDTKYASNDDFETNAEIFIDLQARLDSAILELHKIKSDIKVWSEGVMDSEEESAAEDYELLCARNNLIRAIKETKSAKYNLDCFEEVRNSDFFEENGPA